MDHLLDVLDRRVSFVVMRAERVRVIAESADRHAVLGDRLVNLFRFGGAEVADIHMRDAGIPPLGFADRPAAEFDSVVALGLRDLADFIEREFGQDRTDESELHEMTF